MRHFLASSPLAQSHRTSAFCCFMRSVSASYTLFSLRVTAPPRPYSRGTLVKIDGRSAWMSSMIFRVLPW